MRGLRRLGAIVLFAALLGAGWRLAAGNSIEVEVDYIFGALSAIALWKALGLALLLGAGTTGTLFGLALIRARLETRRYRKEMRGLEAEVHQLRNLPLVGDETALVPDDFVVASAEGATRST